MSNMIIKFSRFTLIRSRLSKTQIYDSKNVEDKTTRTCLCSGKEYHLYLKFSPRVKFLSSYKTLCYKDPKFKICSHSLLSYEISKTNTYL